jgi:uncharacterized protein YceK
MRLLLLSLAACLALSGCASTLVEAWRDSAYGNCAQEGRRDQRVDCTDHVDEVVRGLLMD